MALVIAGTASGCVGMAPSPGGPSAIGAHDTDGQSPTAAHTTTRCRLGLKDEPAQFTRLETPLASTWWVYFGTIDNVCSHEATLTAIHVLPGSPLQGSLLGAWEATVLTTNLTPDSYTPISGVLTVPDVTGRTIPGARMMSLRAAVRLPSDLSQPRDMPVVDVTVRVDGVDQTLELKSPCGFTSAPSVGNTPT